VFFIVFSRIDSQFLFFQWVEHVRNLDVFIKEKPQLCFSKSVISALPDIDFMYTGIALFLSSAVYFKPV